jgi:hypothetical protein
VPFTPSHAVVALAFLRGPIVPAAVAVGAMAPDLPLFVRALPLDYGRTHSFAWLPLTVVVALVLLLVWRCVLRPAVRELSPGWLARRLPVEWDADAGAAARETFARRGAHLPSWAGVALLLVGLAVGVASHIAWDWFTHEGRVGTTALPGLDASWGPLPGYKWLQYGSSVLGLVVLGIWAIAWLRRARTDTVGRVLPAWVRVAWWFSLPVILVGAWVLGLALFGPFTAEFTPQHLGYRMLPPACAIWGLLTLAVCVVAQLARRRVRSRP